MPLLGYCKECQKQPESNHEERNSDFCSSGERSIKQLPWSLQKCECHKRQRQRNSSRLNETKQTQRVILAQGEKGFYAGQCQGIRRDMPGGQRQISDHYQVGVQEPRSSSWSGPGYHHSYFPCLKLRALWVQKSWLPGGTPSLVETTRIPLHYTAA